MGLLDRLRKAGADRARDRSVARYRRSVDEWLVTCRQLAEYMSIAANPGMSASASPLQLGRGERLLAYWTGAELIAPKNVRVTTWTSASYKVTSKTTVRAGSAVTSTTQDQPTPIDRGTIAITDTRVVFLGKTRTVEWQFRRLVGVTHDPENRWSALHVSNRQRVNGFSYPRQHAHDVRFHLELALALFAGEQDQFAGGLVREFEDLVAAAPRPPDGTPSDERVESVRQIGAGKAQSTALPAPTKSAQVRMGFATTPPEVVGEALRLAGFLVTVEVDGSDPWPPERTQTEMQQQSQTEQRRWTAVLAGDAMFAASYLDVISGAVVVAICSTPEELSDLEVVIVDEDDFMPSVAGDLRDADEVEAELRGQGFNVLKARLTEVPTSATIAALDAGARVARHIHPQPQALVVAGSQAVLAPFRSGMRGLDAIVGCGTEADLQAAGYAAPSHDEEAETPVNTMSVPPISIAGRTIEKPLEAVLDYIAEHGGTVSHYDLFDADDDRVNDDLIRATRSPWMNSRISAEEGRWFIERATTAPWDVLARDADLAEADPTQVGGVYDRASELYAHFFDVAPNGVSTAKVSKVLHLLRPRFFPILDSRLMDFYDSAAKAAAKRATAARPELARFRRLHWAAVREDVVANRSALDQLRSALAQSTAPLAAEVADRVGDVRLLDMLAWAASGRSTDDA